MNRNNPPKKSGKASELGFHEKEGLELEKIGDT